MVVNYEVVGQHDFAVDVELKELSNNDFGVIETNVKFWLKVVLNHELVLVGQDDVATYVELKESKTNVIKHQRL